MNEHIPPIVCVECKAKLYQCQLVGKCFSGTKAEAKHFVPISIDIAQPKDGDKMICPRCGEDFGVTIDQRGAMVFMLEGECWWPHPPSRTLK